MTKYATQTNYIDKEEQQSQGETNQRGMTNIMRLTNTKNIFIIALCWFTILWTAI